MNYAVIALVASAIATSTAFASGPFGQNSCINVGSNSVVNFGSIGNYVGGDVTGSGNTFQLGHQITCAPLTSTFQANAAIQKSFQAGIPFSIGLHGQGRGQGYGHGQGHGSPSDGANSLQANLSAVQFACGIDDTTNALFQSNLFTNQFNAQACQGSIDDLINLPVWLGPISH